MPGGGLGNTPLPGCGTAHPLPPLPPSCHELSFHPASSHSVEDALGHDAGSQRPWRQSSLPLPRSPPPPIGAESAGHGRCDGSLARRPPRAKLKIEPRQYARERVLRDTPHTKPMRTCMYHRHVRPRHPCTKSCQFTARPSPLRDMKGAMHTHVYVRRLLHDGVGHCRFVCSCEVCLCIMRVG